MYLIKNDYRKQIQDVNLNQIISSDDTILSSAQLTAQSECLSYLRQKYDTSKEFTDTKIWSYSTAYVPHDRVYLDADAYSPTSTYALNALTLFGGNVYRCTTAVTVAETFTLSKWSLIGPQYTIYYAVYPAPLFNYKKIYAVGDIVYYGDRKYTCRQATTLPTHSAQIQYGTIAALPQGNVFPDDPVYGAKYWTPFVSAYTVPAGTALSNTTYWTKADNRDQQMVTYLIDITLFHIHSRIAPRNVPQLRIDRYTQAVQWLTAAAQGAITAALPLLQPDQGNRIRFGGNVKNQNRY